MKIRSVEAYAIRLPRDTARTSGTAGSPTPLQHGSRLQWASTYPTIYSAFLEASLIRVETEDGVVGWGEAQAPVAPEIVKSIVDHLLGPILTGIDVTGPEEAWDLMYASMRVRGHFGGFFLDAISGIDMALWDIRGKVESKSVSELLAGASLTEVSTYISGVRGDNQQERVSFVREWIANGATAFKIFLHGSQAECLSTLEAIRNEFGEPIKLFVDALWRLDLVQAIEFAEALGRYNVSFLEAPLMPEDVDSHRLLAEQSPLPIAIGESYRTRFEIGPFLRAGACGVLQPDLGRCGITEGRRIAALAEQLGVPMIPHLSIGLGPQIAAAIHFSAATPGVQMLECNPQVYTTANEFLVAPIAFTSSTAKVPSGAGLGIELDEAILNRSLHMV
jgi:D-galactarolactone cycloisomerase